MGQSQRTGGGGSRRHGGGSAGGVAAGKLPSGRALGWRAVLCTAAGLTIRPAQSIATRPACSLPGYNARKWQARARAPSKRHRHAAQRTFCKAASLACSSAWLGCAPPLSAARLAMAASLSWPAGLKGVRGWNAGGSGARGSGPQHSAAGSLPNCRSATWM